MPEIHISQRFFRHDCSSSPEKPHFMLWNFIPHYNKGMKYILKCIGFVMIIILCLNILHWLVVDDTRSYTRLMMHEFYSQDQIDILFVGSSHCYGALDPEVTDPIFGLNTFNVGSSEQGLDASFALIREAVNRYNVKKIYLEMYYHKMMNDEYMDRVQ